GLLYLIFGNLYDAFISMFSLRGRPNTTKDALSSLSSIWTLIITIYSVGITAIFSYLVWKVSEDSLQVSEDLRNLEKKRDSENEREQALIVYYDLQHGFTYIKDLYISLIIKNKNPNPTRMFFSEDWIKNVATLRNNLTRSELNNVYQLYNDFFTLQNLLENYNNSIEKDNSDIHKFISELGEKVFADFLPLKRLDYFDESPVEDLINIDLYILLYKIYMFTYPKTQIESINRGNGYDVLINGVKYYTLKSGDIFNGEAIIYTTNGEEKAVGFIIQGIFTTGKVYGYGPNQKLYSINYEKTSQARNIIQGYLINPRSNEGNGLFYDGDFKDGKIFNGFSTEFHSNGHLKFQGVLVNGLKEGNGKLFDSNGNLYFEGIYEQNEGVEGELFNNRKSSFKGTFKHGKPWNGHAENRDFTSLYVLNFTGEVVNGKPYSGQGFRFKRSANEESLEERYNIDYWEPDEEHYQVQEEDFLVAVNEKIREEYWEWSDYIKTDWKDGDYEEREDTELNIILTYNENSKK
ncbi:hypothetical protein U8V97_12535, partial [Priestia filamentosa]|uniref:hypothetical protein n=1 Tax=Priestia filamentosa TaxID=1402861 RepID=UPI00397E209E